jgi:hypothetical protein
MSCPLTDARVADVVERLPESFNTLKFIAGCPNGGGDASGAACPVVVRSGGRALCGKRLAAFQAQPGSGLDKNNRVSPARWRKRGATPDAAPRPAHRKTRRRSDWDSRMRAHQVHWKTEVAGVAETGTHQGSARDYLFPPRLQSSNLLPGFAAVIDAELARHGVTSHTYAHHVMSSQAFALNLGAPFFQAPEALLPVLRSVLPPALGARVAKVSRIEPEYDGDTNYFGEPGRRGSNRTSSDLAVWWQDVDGRECLLLIEVKFSERAFGDCNKGRKHRGVCDTGGSELVQSCGAGCPLTGPGLNRGYWAHMQKTALFHPERLAQTRACPFRADGYQLMRNQLLAAVIEQDPSRPEHRVDFAVLFHSGNPHVLKPTGFPGAERGLRAWADLLRAPDRFHLIPAQAWVGAAPTETDSWKAAFSERYLAEHLNT